MEIEFNESIDPATFNATDALILTPSGQTNAVSAVQTINSNRFRIMFPPLATSGIHQLLVGPNIQDLAGNSLDQDRDGLAGEATDDVYDACVFVHEPGSSPGLVGWWRGEGSAFDSAGANDGALQNGVSFALGKVGSAFAFDGTDDFVQVSNALSLRLSGEFSIEFWFRPSATITPSDSVAHTMFSKGTTDSIGTANNSGRMEVRGPSPRPTSTTSTWYSNNWYHVAVTYSQSTYRL